MRNTLILAAIAALAFATIADAKTCTDPTTHKYVKCPAAAAAPAKPAAATPAAKPTMSKTKAGTTFKAPAPAKPATAPKTASTGGAPHCTKGKPCGKSCIAMDKVCHK